MTFPSQVKTRSINRYFLRIFIPIVLLVSTAISALLAWNDYEANKTSRLESQKLILETFAATIRQPLLQGSVIEARIRANELVKNKQVYCIEITSMSETIQNCKNLKEASDGLNRMETDLYFSEDRSNPMGHLVITFDNTDLISGIFKNMGKNVGGFVSLAAILFLALSIGFSRIRLETNELMKIVEGHRDGKNDGAQFKITEFASLGKNLKHQLEVSKVAAEAKAALDIARQVAHDIRSPIASLQIVLQVAQGKIDPSIKNVLSHSAQRISDIANDVISQYTPRNQPRDENQAVNKLPMSLNLALSEMVAEKRLLCSGTATVDIQINPFATDLFIEMRVSDFKRIISNLIDNAIQAVSANGRVEIICTQTDSECCISIADNGVGIPTVILKVILEKGGSYGKPGGKGLGLQWAKQAAERHGGRLTIESEQTLGTTVSIFLPTLAGQNVRPHVGTQLCLVNEA